MPELFTTFIDEPDTSAETIALHAPDGKNWAQSTVVVIKERETYKPILNLAITSEYSSPFRETQIYNDAVLIGWGNTFILYNLTSGKSKILILDWYFGDYRIHDEKIFVCSATDINCLSIDGEVFWKSDPIAVDGIVINSFEGQAIYCSCELDPPGGWVSYKLDLLTGKVLKNIS